MDKKENQVHQVSQEEEESLEHQVAQLLKEKEGL
jgi:hypothetical protein